jgi:hypothetical protein
LAQATCEAEQAGIEPISPLNEPAGKVDGIPGEQRGACFELSNSESRAGPHSIHTVTDPNLARTSS